MERCPSCGQSRWVYPRDLAVAHFTNWLAGLRPYECLSCGWRGWRAHRSSRNPWARHAARLRAAVAYVARALDRGAAMAEQRLASLPRLEVPTLAKWLILAFALGLGLGSLAFLGEEGVAEPQTLSAARVPGSIPSLEPTSASSGIAVTPPPPSGLPGATRIERSPAVPTSGKVLAKTSAPPRQARTRGPVAPPASKPASAVERSTAVQLPRYRGSLAIDSDPSGAVVSLDGRVVGSTPILLEDVPAGSRVVRVESSGYERWSAAIRVVANQRTRVNATLQAGSEPQAPASR